MSCIVITEGVAHSIIIVSSVGTCRILKPGQSPGCSESNTGVYKASQTVASWRLWLEVQAEKRHHTLLPCFGPTKRLFTVSSFFLMQGCAPGTSPVCITCSLVSAGMDFSSTEEMPLISGIAINHTMVVN